MGSFRRDAVSVYAAGALVAILGYVLTESPTVASACLVLVALAAVAAQIAGPRLHRAPHRAPWDFVAASGVAFVAGALLRPWAAGLRDLRGALPDACTLTGYALLFCGLGLLLKHRGSLERHAIVDGLIVCLGFGLFSVLYFVIPAVQISSRLPLISMLAGVYPVLDIVMLLILLNLAFTSALKLLSFRFLVLAMVFFMIGDLGYATIGARGQLSGSRWLDLPFLITYSCFGIAALHPSMARLTSLTGRRVQAWSLPRLALLVPSLLAPSAALLVHPPVGVWQRALVGVVTTGIVTALLVRAVSAVRGLARTQDVLRRQSTHDGLTGLANRTLLLEQLEIRLAGRRRGEEDLWLLFVDLDGFKFVNDSWGHETGDRLLMNVADRLRQLAGPGLVARIGDASFAVTVTADRPSDEGLIRRILDGLQDSPVSGMELTASAYIGMVAAQRYSSAEGMLRDADTAAYRARRDGNGRWIEFAPAMREDVRDRIEIELALRNALARDQLWVAYQPVTDLVDEQTVGCEALLRWAHPRRGEISPNDFIPLAEETGLIMEIGEFVLRQAVGQTASWLRDGVVGPSFFTSVNVSARQLADPGLADLVARTLDDAGLAPAHLVVEVTESIMVDRTGVVMANLNRLRETGVRLSVDDFGTGYSALSYLTSYPMTGVKIDRSFVRGLEPGNDDEVVVRAVAALAQALGLSVVAEGVETEAQRDVLRAIGVPYGQGWLWGRAVDATTFSEAHGRARPVPAAVPQATTGTS